MATTCPLCKKDNLKVIKKDDIVIGVDCNGAHYIRKDDGNYENDGCKFKLLFDQQKFYQKTFTSDEIKQIINGGSVKGKNEDGNEVEIVLNLKNKNFLGYKKKEREDF